MQSIRVIVVLSKSNRLEKEHYPLLMYSSPPPEYIFTQYLYFSSAMFLFLAFTICWGLHLTSTSLSAHHKNPSQELNPGNWPIHTYYLPIKALQCDYRKIFTSTLRHGSAFSAKWPHHPKHQICLVKCSFVNIV